MSRNDMIDGQMPHLSATILAHKFITAQNFSFRQSDAGSWPLNHIREANDGGNFEFCRRTSNYSSTIEDNLCLSGKHKGERAFGITNMQRLEVHVQDEHRLL